MVRVIVLLLFTAALAYMPVWIFDNNVLPQLFSLKSLYGDAEVTARRVVEERPSRN